MIPVKTQPKFKCDFCKRRSIKSAMERHEKRCFRNPNRFCETCNNKGVVTEYYDFGHQEDRGCPYCSTENKEKTKEIDKYYAELN